MWERCPVLFEQPRTAGISATQYMEVLDERTTTLTLVPRNVKVTDFLDILLVSFGLT